MEGIKLGDLEFPSVEFAEKYFCRNIKTIKKLLGEGFRVEEILRYKSMKSFLEPYGLKEASIRHWQKRDRECGGTGNVRVAMLQSRVARERNEAESKYSLRDRAKVHCFSKKRYKDCTPSWLTTAERSKMVDVYVKSKGLTGMTVDHIIPLNGENVCGLHVLSNLQIIPYDDNMGKGNEH